MYNPYNYNQYPSSGGQQYPQQNPQQIPQQTSPFAVAPQTAYGSAQQQYQQPAQVSHQAYQHSPQFYAPPAQITQQPPQQFSPVAPPTNYNPVAAPPSTPPASSPLPPPPTEFGVQQNAEINQSLAGIPPSQPSTMPQPAFDYSYGSAQPPPSFNQGASAMPPPPSEYDFEGGSRSAPQAYQASPATYQQQMQQQQQYPQYPVGQTGVEHVESQMAQMNLNTSQQSFFAATATTTQADQLPRPAASTFLYEVPQPDVSPLFDRRNQQAKADFSRAQSSSRFLRTTVQCIPNSTAISGKWSLPMGAIIHPFAEPAEGDAVPVVNMTHAGIIRCNKCRTYVNPFVLFLDGGRKWQCNLCRKVNDVPNEYFCPLDEFGLRKDIVKRAELRCGTVDFIAPQEYTARPPQPPVYFFLIDVSYPAIASGMVQVVAKTIKQMLDSLPGDVRTKVGFITFDSSIHFYNLKPTLSQPQMLVVGELQESILPIPTDLLVNLDESRRVVDALLDRLSTTMFARTQNVESALGAALNSAGRIMSRIGGKMMVFLSNLPTLGPNSLQNRDQMSLYGTENEKQLQAPAHPNFKELALVYSRDQIAVDLFVASEQYVDLATLSALPKLTGGQVSYYQNFKADVDGEKLKQDLMRVLSRETGFEAVMRVRVSSGLKINNFYGNFFIRSHDLLALPNVDADKGFGVDFSISGGFISTPNAAIQAAVLYTSSTGERRIRVHNVTLPITASLADMYKFADVESTIALMSKMMADDIQRYGFSTLRNRIRDITVATLKNYRENVSKANMLSNQLVLPDSLRLLPLYAACLSRSDLLMGGNDIRADERAAAIQRFECASVTQTMLMVHPALFPVHEHAAVISQQPEAADALPTKLMPLSRNFLAENGVYILTDSTEIYVWVGKQVAADSDTLNDIISTTQRLNMSAEKNTEEENEEEDQLPAEATTEIGKALEKVVAVLRRKFGYALVRLATGDHLKRFHLRKLAEDKSANFVLGYDEYIRQIYQLIGN